MSRFVNTTANFGKGIICDDMKIRDFDFVKLKKINKLPVATYMRHMNTKIRIKKLDKNRYVDLRTGEIIFSKHIGSRIEGLNEVKIAMSNVRDLLNHNFNGAINEKWIILTYRFIDGEPMTDTVKLYKDVVKFIKTARRKLGHFEYVAIPEPQGTGNWHMNIAAKFDKNPGKIEPKELEKMCWDHGFCYVKRIYGKVGLGNYLSVYLTDMELEEFDNFIARSKAKNEDLNECKIIEKMVEGKSKKFVKGARLFFYRPGLRMFRKSKGIVFPEIDQGGLAEVKKRNGLSGKSPTYGSITSIFEDSSSECVNEIKRNYFDLSVRGSVK